MLASSYAKPTRLENQLNDTRITPSCGNVFMDFGFDEAEAIVMALRVALMVQLRNQVSIAGLTQALTAKRLGVS